MFKIEKTIKDHLGRAGIINTPHGEIKTPAFSAVGTKATVKTLTPKQIRETGIQVVLANTFHLYLQPGEKLIRKNGGLGKMMAWDGPTITDSGGFQVFSLGSAYGKKISKIGISENDEKVQYKHDGKVSKMVKIDEDGVDFKSPIDGSSHRLTPEKSIDIQRDIGADIIFAFDECTSPLAPYEYQKEAMERTHRWAERSLKQHKTGGEGKIKKLTKSLLRIEEEKRNQFLFGIIQGGRFEDLRKESARIISKMDFDGFGIGGSFEKKDIETALSWVNKILPQEKPRHLLGIGEPLDIFKAVENGADIFDCVMPTRLARNGTLLTNNGRINILNSKFSKDLTSIEEECKCYSCLNFNKCYISHLFKAKEMLALTLATIHNLYFINSVMDRIRESILENRFPKLKEEFFSKYKK